MNMRKIIAVMAAVLMLCSVIPMSAMVSADGNFNFENGSVSGWQSGCSIAVVEDNGSQVLKFDASGANWANVYYYGSSIVKANTDYTVSLRVKADRNTNMNFKVNNNWSGDTAKWTFNVTTEWQELTYVINSGACTSGALLLFSSNTEAANGATYYLDDISFVEYVEPVAPGTVANGDFEKGDLSGWEKHQSTTISTDAHSGSYAANIKGNGGWGGMLNQNVTVEAGKTYRISLWIKANSNGANVQIKDGGTSGNNLASTWFTKTSWTNLTWEVIPTTNIICFNFCGGGNGVAEDVLVDDITVTELKPASNDGYITNGDFEIGAETPWTVYSGTAVSAAAAKDGDYGLYIKNPNGGWGGTAYQNFTTEIGKTYVVMMDAKAIANGQNIQIKDNGTTKASKWFTTTSWTTLSFEYTAESTNGMINICGGGTGGNEEIYVDNVFVFVKKAASNDGYIVNGDFETGTTEGLSPSQSTCVSRDAAKDGNFGLKMMGNGGWGGVGLWTINGLEAGATYKFEMDMNAIASGFNWTLWQDSTNSGSKYASGYFSTTEWTHIEKEFVANSAVAVLNINGGGTGTPETVYLDNLKITLVKSAHTCEYVGVETQAPTCTEDGVMTYTCGGCGDSYTEAIPAAHTYTDNCDEYCDVCDEWRIAEHNLTYVPGVVPANCQETGYDEYWECQDCGKLFGDAEGSWQVNPAWIYYTGDCVRPEGSIPCAVVPCVVCGNDTYGDACTRPEDAPACQDAECVYCGELIWGEGHSYGYDEETWESLIPLCQPGDCIYCGEHLEYIYEHENGSWAPCSVDGECAYGCGLQYPATGEHMFDEGQNVCTGGLCWLCWEEIEAAGHSYDAVVTEPDCTNGGYTTHTCGGCGDSYVDNETEALGHTSSGPATCEEDEYCTVCDRILNYALGHEYDNEFDVDCNVCGDIRKIEIEFEQNGGCSVRDDEDNIIGLAAKFDITVEGLAIKEGKFTQADYTNATIGGYKLISMGVVASNGASSVDIEAKYLYELDEASASASFVARVINIPTEHLDTKITFQSYFVIEIDGVAVRVNGSVQANSYNGALPQA